MTGRKLELDAIAMITGLALGWVAFAVIVWAYGESPRAMAALLWDGTWGTAYGAGQVVFKATPILFSGIAVHLALRAGLFNIGAEGQMAIASLAVAAVGAALGSRVPGFVALPLLLVVAAAAGALWAMGPALLRAKLGAHEVISTIMTNRIADALVGLLLGLGLAQKGTVRTPDVAPAARLQRLGHWLRSLEGSAANTSIFVALVVLVLAAFVWPRTRAGREQALVGLGFHACEAEGVPVARRLTEALMVSGAVAGLASSATVLGYKGYYEQGLGAGAGFTGLAVALLGRGRAAGIVFAALLFGTLDQGGLALNATIPREAMQVVQAVVILAVALGDERVRAWIRSAPAILARRGATA